MRTIAIIEDDKPTSNLFKEWLSDFYVKKDGLEISQFFDRDSAEEALCSKVYDVVVLDIQLGIERNAGIGLKNDYLSGKDVPVIVVSGLPAEIYRPIMHEMKAWDYLEKPVAKDSFISLVTRAIRTKKNAPTSPNEENDREISGTLQVDPLHRRHAHWKGKRLNMPMTAQRLAHTLYEKKDKLVGYDELYECLVSGKNPSSLRTHIKNIRLAFQEVDPNFDNIVNVPMAGYMWKSE